MFRLLDIAFPGRPYHHKPRIIDPVVQKVVVKDVPADTADVHNQVADTLAADTVTNNDAFIGNIGAGGDDNTMLMWSLVVVLFALAMCLYFVYIYRQRSYRLG